MHTSGIIQGVAPTTRTITYQDTSLHCNTTTFGLAKPLANAKQIFSLDLILSLR